MWANSEGSGETARMRRLVWAVAGRLCDYWHNLMGCLISENTILTGFEVFRNLFDTYTEQPLPYGRVITSTPFHTCCGEQTSSFPYEPPHDKTNKTTVRSANTQISLGIRPVRSVSLLCAQWLAKDLSFHHADNEDSDQTGRMPRLIWVFAGRTCHFVGFVMRRLIC